ncbi:MAG TPA: hypothetical protein VMW65_18700 [Chloroflexota bacterium]|nr:hypothetical protein [Chloroflexota bacterium]
MGQTTIAVTPVQSKSDFDAFVELPWQVPEDRQMVRPMREFQRHLFDRGHRFRGSASLAAQLDGMLLGKENPFYEHGDLELFLARVENRPVARIVAIQNRLHNEYHHDQTGFFGFYECIDGGEAGRAATQAVVAAASSWLQQRGLTTIRGPFNPTINDDCGIWTEGDRYPSFLMPSNPRFYASHLQAAGFTTAKTLRVYRLDLTSIPEKEWTRWGKMAERIQRATKVHLRAANFKDLDSEVKSFLTIYNSALANNWGFAPMSFKELRSMAELFQYMIDSNLIRAAEVEENGVRKVVGAVISVPDLNEFLRHSSGRLVHPSTIWKLGRMKMGQHTDRIRVVFLGVLPEYHHTPASVLLLYDTMRMARKFGAREAEGSWILEDNPAMYRPLEDHGFQVTDRYVIYERPTD